MLTSGVHHLIKTINTTLKMIRKQIQFIQFLLTIPFRFPLLNRLQSKSLSPKQQ